MQKPKEFDWKDSNIAGFGSKEDRATKKSAAESEKAWEGSGQQVGTEVWRINKFKVEKWPKEDLGKFFNGDSYIILNTYKEEDSDEFLMDVHFWIGKNSTQDEYGTAAYKTVELDTFHNDKPIQHREVEGHESRLFKSYFPTMTTLEGGVDSGFKRVKPTEYKKRLFQVVGERKRINVNEIPLTKGSINSEDVFILDLGLEIIQFNGKDANKDEKFKATQYLQVLKSERSGKAKVIVIDENSISENHKFWINLPDGSAEKKADTGNNEKGMFRISDAKGNLSIAKVSDTLDKSRLDSDDVFLVDAGDELFVWLGKGASVDERSNAMMYAHSYLKDKQNPFTPVTCLGEVQASKNKFFMSLFE